MNAKDACQSKTSKTAAGQKQFKQSKHHVSPTCMPPAKTMKSKKFRRIVFQSLFLAFSVILIADGFRFPDRKEESCKDKARII
jgi:hypothetical protein